MEPLPIDELLPGVVAALGRAPSLVLEAAPGAGKTTRVPPAILDAGLVDDREIWVLEPRRLAARLAARRVADERGERPGDTIGFQIRFEEVAGPKTRIRYVTEGVLTRRLLSDPTLDRIGAVVLDEFHERHIQADLGLSLLRRLQHTARPDLKLVVMSATLEAASVSRFLDNCPALRSEGRMYGVEIEHADRQDDRPLADRVAGAVRTLVAGGLDGDVLVFLPGAAEIRRAAEASAAIANRENLLVVPLHGDLPAAEQDRAVRPADRRKVILSTNVAETSVTIDGVVAVVDSGLARVAGHSPWSGLPTIAVSRVSQASATQRAGRAGRTRPGRCIRLYTAQDFAARPEHETPEIRRLDLAEPALELHAAGIENLHSFEWFEPPPAEALDAADGLLVRLGAVTTDGRVTATGRRMLRLPLHPRLARIVVEAEARGVGAEGRLVAALAGERDLRERSVVGGARGVRQARSHGPSDLLELADLFREAEAAGFAPERLRSMGLDPGAARAVDRVRRQLARVVGDTRGREVAADDSALLVSVLTGYPDRVARRRSKESDAGLVMTNGAAAELAPESVVRRAKFLVAVDAEERREASRRGATLVRIASMIEPDWLLDVFPEAIRETTDVRWNARDERVEAVSRLLYEDLVLTESRAATPTGDEVWRALADAALAVGIEAFVARDALDRFLARAEFVRATFPESAIPELGEEEEQAALAAMCEGRTSFAELRAAARSGELVESLRGRLTREQARLVEAMAPDRVAVGSRQVRVTYEHGKPPWIASRLQDFFGMREGPRIAGGRAAVVLHLLAPNQRAVQVTSDLAGFWERHYPAIRRELGRRYPRHSWPERPV